MADKNVKVTLDADIAKFVLGLKAAGLSADNLAKSIEDAGRKGSEGFEKATRNTEKVAERAQLKFHALATSVAAGLPAAGSAAIAAATAGAAGAFAALGAVALKENEKVKQSFTQLGSEVKTALASDAKVLEGSFVRISQTLSQSFEELRPQLREVFAAIGPDLEIATKGIGDLAHNAMPGLVASVENAAPVFVGLRSMLGEVGSGVSEFFTEVSQHSVAAGHGLSQLGGVVRTLLDTAAPILGDLTDLWAQHGDEVVSVLHQVGGVVDGFTHGALIPLSSAVGGALRVFGSLADLLGPISGQIGTVAGAYVAAKLAIGGISKIATPAAGAMSKLGDSVFGFGGKVETATGKSSGLLGKLGGVAGFLGGPWGVAIGTGISLLAAFGDTSQDVADATQTVTTALEKSKGAWDDNAKAALFNSQPYQDVADDVDAAGISQKEFLDSLTKGGPAADAMVRRLHAMDDGYTSAKNAGADVTDQQRRQQDAVVALLDAYPGLRKVVGDSTRGQKQYTDATGAATAATDKSTDSYNKNARSIYDVILAKERLAGKALTEREAQRNLQDALDSATAALKSNGHNLNINTKAGRANQAALDAVAKSGLDVVDAMHKNGASTAAIRGSLASTRHQFINLATSMGMSKTQAIHLANTLGLTVTKNLGTVKERAKAGRTEFGRVAHQFGLTSYQASSLALMLGDKLNPKTLKTRDGMKAAKDAIYKAARQMGLGKEAARKLTDRLVKIPGKYEADILADTDPANNSLNKFYRNWNGKKITVKVLGTDAAGHEVSVTNTGQVRHFGGHSMATGGPVTGPGGPTADRVPIWASNGEHMWTAKEVAAVGGQQRMLELRKLALTGGLGRAKGGPITFSSGADTSNATAALHASIAAWSKALKEQYAGGFGGVGPRATGSNQRIIQQVFARNGWASQWGATYKLLMSESGFRNTAQNPTSTAYGMFQFLNGTWGSVGGHKTSDPFLQAVYGARYIKSKYGNPANAWAFHLAHNWYDQGGWLMPGATMAFNGTRQPEAVFTQKQLDSMSGETHFHVHIDGNIVGTTPREVENVVVRALSSAKAGGRLHGLTR